MDNRLPRWAASFLLVLATLTMTFVATDAQARRFGGGLSFGRQSTNIMKQRQAVKPPVAKTTPSKANSATNKGTAASGAKAGASRWLGPIAGIAAGLGIAALLSSLGLSGAFLEFLSSAILIGLVIFAVMFILRRLRGGSGLASATAGGNRGASNKYTSEHNSYRQANVNGATPTAAPIIEAVASTQAHDPTWFIPEDFDVPTFLEQAKDQFKHVQALWDAGDRNALQDLLTDDLLREITPSLPSPEEANLTEVVLLNAELMGIEEVAGGYLASVRYSGMLRESKNGQANHFEEVWNLYKANNQGWLLAGIQHINN